MDPSYSLISTGSLKLDIALGGGIPAGYITEIFGPETSGKTSLCLNILAQAQKQDGVCALIDMDATLDQRHAVRCGINPDLLLVSRPSVPLQAFDITMTLLRSHQLAAVVIDSINPWLPPEEGAGRGAVTAQVDAHQDSIEWFLPMALHRLEPLARQSRTALICTFQVPHKVRPVYWNLQVNLLSLALRSHAAVSLSLSAVDEIHGPGQHKDCNMQLKIIRNRIFPPSYTRPIDIMYNGSIDCAGEAFDLGKEYRVITRTNALYCFQGVPLGNNRDTVVSFLWNNPGIRKAIGQVIFQKALPSDLASLEE